MKKLFVIAFAACVAFSFTSCKSSKNAYKTAYDEARQAELVEVNGQEKESAEIAPVATSTNTARTDVDTTYRTEKVVLSSGNEGSLKAFSVVCGSYSRKEGAENIRQSLVDEGYNAIVVQNPTTGLYRVVCASCDTKEEAAVARDKFKAEHPRNNDYQKAWLLYNK
ncbi:MAG: SPOR domain-containing protein [Bacteroidaceae bacterium]|jgi:cell division protein FtsN|nr:SPOR domain-containing protein [Bacteroidaceae bacterium]